jgi:phosphodiester glycosidase
MMSGRFIFKTLFFFLWTILSIAGSSGRVSAAENPPPWVEALDCQKDLQIYKGLQYCITKDGSAYVVVIDLNAENLRIEYVIAEGYDSNGYYGECKDVNIPKYSTGPGCRASNIDYYPIMSLTNAAQRIENAAVVINSDYGAGDQGRPGEFRGHGPEGFTVIRGDRIDGLKYNDTDNNAENRPWLAIGQGSPIRVELNQYPSGQDDEGKADWIYTGVGGGPWLMKDEAEEKDIDVICDREYSGSCYKGAAQTVVGISSDGQWLFFVIVKSSSKDLHEAIHILKDLDVGNAIKMDGGGSSQLYYGGLPNEKKIVTAGDGRQLSQYLAIIAQPGNGINLDGSSAPTEPGSDLTWWQKIQKSWNDLVARWEEFRKSWSDRWEKFSNWWKDFQKDPTKWFDDWLKKQQEKLFKQWEQQLVEWLNQLCGSAALIPVTLAIVWMTRRRKHNSL